VSGKQAKFKVGDRVVDQGTGEKGEVSRLCLDEDCVQVKWDSGMQQLMEVKELKRLE
jgi:hypothetical protein